MPSTRVPKYHRVADALRAQIRGGELAPGDRLPAESALAATYRVSPPVVRQALDVLRGEGLITSSQGKGSFVRQEHRFERRSRARYGEARGRTGLLTNHLRHEITSAGPEPLAVSIAPLMNAAPGSEVIVRRRRLYDENDELQEIGASHLPVSFAADTYLAEPTVVPKALFLCVEDLTGDRYSQAEDRWVARPATIEECEDFGLANGAYVVHVTHKATGANGDVLEVSESIWPADRLAFVDEYAIPAQAEHPAKESDV
ncbi:MAG: GntR family transcriptional regulator [Microbacteriaceae bacterium]|nr:GntR family transcriptional regulator [Microbacteriaceae bacterium]